MHIEKSLLHLPLQKKKKISRRKMKCTQNERKREEKNSLLHFIDFQWNQTLFLFIKENIKFYFHLICCNFNSFKWLNIQFFVHLIVNWFVFCSAIAYLYFFFKDFEWGKTLIFNHNSKKRISKAYLFILKGTKTSKEKHQRRNALLLKLLESLTLFVI